MLPIDYPENLSVRAVREQFPRCERDSESATPNFFSVMPTGRGCWLDLVLVRYKENISWTSSLPLGVCLHVYSTDPASSSDDMIIIPNTGREALGFATHVRRMIDRGLHPAPLTAFMQALPHCAWNSDGSDLCIRETKEMLASLPASNITERGGVIMLGSRRPLGLNQGLFGGQAQGDPCAPAICVRGRT